MVDNYKVLDNLAREVKKRRKALRLTQVGLGRKAALSGEAVRNMELCKGCNVTTVIAICNTLGIKLNFE